MIDGLFQKICAITYRQLILLREDNIVKQKERIIIRHLINGGEKAGKKGDRRFGDGNKIGAYSPGFNDFIGNTLIRELKMTGRFGEWGIEDGVINYDRHYLSRMLHYSPSSDMLW